jgi:DHA2 family multidrug resistance protein
MDNRWLMIFGFGMFAAASIWFGEADLSISQWSFLWAIIISGFGSGFIFVPLSTTTMAGIPNEQLGNASGLYNLLRNIGGSIGIAVVNTMVIRHQQVHRTELSHDLSMANPNTQSRLLGLQQYLHSRGASPTDALHQAQALLDRSLDGQARLWSYVDDFRALALVCAFCVPLVLALKKTVGRGGVSAGH